MSWKLNLIVPPAAFRPVLQIWRDVAAMFGRGSHGDRRARCEAAPQFCCGLVNARGGCDSDRGAVWIGSGPQPLVRHARRSSLLLPALRLVLPGVVVRARAALEPV